MKKLLVLCVLGLPLMVSGGSVRPANYPSQDVSCEWQRHACAICGKTIWEKVELTTTISPDDLTISGVRGWEIASNFVVLGHDTPVRTSAENLHGEADYKVCPYCLDKYTRAFGETVRKAVKAFVEEAKQKESKRRAEVAQENTQEELRRMEAELQRYTEQVKKLTERLEALKATKAKD